LEEEEESRRRRRKKKKKLRMNMKKVEKKNGEMQRV
jgi:hypothetical protein